MGQCSRISSESRSQGCGGEPRRVALFAESRVFASALVLRRNTTSVPARTAAPALLSAVNHCQCLDWWPVGVKGRMPAVARRNSPLTERWDVAMTNRMLRCGSQYVGCLGSLSPSVRRILRVELGRT